MMKLNDKCFIIMALIISALFSSCSEDELNSKELLAYMRDKTVKVSIANETNLLNSDILVGGAEVANLEIGLSREANVDVTIEAQVDLSLVEQYNVDNKKMYIAVSEEMISLSSVKAVIAAGKIKDTLRIGLNREKFLENETYLLPVRMSAIYSDDKGIEISSNTFITYVIISATVTMNNIDKSETPLSGTRMDKVGWSTVAGGSSHTYKLYDNDLTTFWSAVTSIRIDMKTVQMVKGFDLVNYAGNSLHIKKAPKKVNVYFSNDGVTWVKHGESNELKQPTVVSTTDETYSQVKLLKPQNVRYFRIDVADHWLNSSYLAEIHALK